MTRPTWLTRRRRFWLLTGAVVVAFAFLQVPPLDQWRFHTILTWQVEPSDTTAVQEPPPAVSPPFDMPQYLPTRLTWSAKSVIPQSFTYHLVDVWAGCRDGRLADFYEGPWALVCTVRGLSRLFHKDTVFSSSDLTEEWRSGSFSPPAGSSRGRALIVPMATWNMQSRPSDTFRLIVGPYSLGQPAVTFVVSQPYGYYYLPVEDYLAGMALIGLLVLAVRRARERRRRRRCEFIDEAQDG